MLIIITSGLVKSAGTESDNLSSSEIPNSYSEDVNSSEEPNSSTEEKRAIQKYIESLPENYTSEHPLAFENNGCLNF